MLLTHSDLYAYLESVIDHKSSMPLSLKEYIEKSSNFIFIGLSFDKWYMQLLLRILKQHKNDRALKLAANHSKNEEIESFCYDQFKITCVPNNIIEFVDELFYRCKEAGLIREKQEADVTYYNYLLKVIRQEDNLHRVVDEISTWFNKNHPKDVENINIITQISGRLVTWEKENIKGTMYSQDAKTELSRIRDAILEFLKTVSHIINFENN